MRDEIFERVFQNSSVIKEKLLPYGFQKEGKSFVFRNLICDGQMEVVFTVNEGSMPEANVYDVSIGDVYTMHLCRDAEGSFVGEVRASYEQTLTDIAKNCFQRENFSSDAVRTLTEYVKARYSDELEFPWGEDDGNAVIRRGDNRKWYVVILTVTKDKFGFSSKERVEVIDLRALPEEIDALVDGVKYFRGYHMNKKHWLTMILDGSVPVEEILHRVDESYRLADK